MGDRPKRSLKARLLTAVLAPLVFLVLLESGLWLFDYSWDPSDELAGQAERAELTQPEIYRPHPRWLWTLLPGTTIHVPAAGMVEAATNAEGLRRPELPGSKPADEFRVLCLGDSVTFGLGLTATEAYPARLEAALQEIAGDRRRVRVINGGVPGWSSLSGRRFLEDHPDLAPDVIVFWFGMNDAKEALGAADSRVRIPTKAGPGAAVAWFRQRRTMQLLGRALHGLRGTTTRVSAREYRETLAEMESAAPHRIFVRYPERLDRVVEQLGTVLRRAEQEGVEWVVGPAELLSPFTPAPDGTDLRGTRVTAAEGPALRFSGRGNTLALSVEGLRSDVERLTALTARFRKLMALLPPDGPGYAEMFGAAPPETVFHDNCHMNAAGASRAAAALAQRIRPWLQASLDDR